MGVGEASGPAACPPRSSHSFLLSHLYMAFVESLISAMVVSPTKFEGPTFTEITGTQGPTR